MATLLPAAIVFIDCGVAPLTFAATAKRQVQTSQDIIVTAVRHPEHVSRIPMSIIAKDRATLDRDRIETFADLTRSTPGLSERRGFGGTAKISIRGIASNVGTATTGLYIDEAPLQVRTLGAAGVFSDFRPELFDLARVEVLRGPQGTLFGEDSEGGTIRFITTEPDLGQTTAYGKASLATTKGGKPSFFVGQALSIPLIDDVAAIRVSGSARQDGGWIDRVPYTGYGRAVHDANGREATSMRAALKLEPSSGLTVQSSFYYQDERRHDTDQYWESLSDIPDGAYVSGQPLAQPLSDKLAIFALKAEKDMGWASLTVNSSWLMRKNRLTIDYTNHLVEGLSKSTFYELPGAPQYAVPAKFVAKQNKFVDEIRLASPVSASKVSWILGIRYSNERQRIEQKIIDPLLGTLTNTLYGCTPVQCFGEDLLAGNLSYYAADRSQDRHIAAFGSADWKLVKRLTLTTGIRIEHTSSTIENSQNGPFNFGPTGGTMHVAGNDVSPRIALTYNVDKSGILYASVARGARPGGGNTGIPLAFCAGDLAALGAGPPDGYKGDSVWTFELGTKLHKGPVDVDGSVFLSRWRGIQQSVALPNCGFAFTSNLGSAVSRGFDVQISGRPISGLEIATSVTFTDAHYINDERFGSGSPLSLAGDTLPIPAWQTRVSGRYERPLGASIVALQMDYDHSSAYNALPSPPAFNSDPLVARAAATDLVGARASLSSGAWRLTVFIDNLLNSGDRLSRTRDSPFEQTIRDQGFRPRTMGVEFVFDLK